MVRLRVPVTSDFGNSYGYMHGGAAAVVSDVGLHRLRCHVPAGLDGARVQSMSLEYLAPVPLADTVTLTARVAERGKSKALAVVGIKGMTCTASTVASYTLRLASGS
jgi:acyl-coenzyme A thioesterase PaaI-like protein